MSFFSPLSIRPQIADSELANACLAFLLEVAAENDKVQRKQAEDEGVFFRFGNDQGRGLAGLVAPQDSLSIWRLTLSMAACIRSMLA